MAQDNSNLRTINTFSTEASKEILTEKVNLPYGIFPNPADNEAVISVNENKGQFNVQVYSSNGKLMEALTINSDTSRTGEYVLETDKLADGFYIVVLLFENGGTEVHKLIIAH